MQSQKAERPIGRTNAVVLTRRELIPWIWQGVVAERAVTLLEARGRIGPAGQEVAAGQRLGARCQQRLHRGQQGRAEGANLRHGPDDAGAHRLGAII
jgi:hypothetical protein